MEGVKHLNLNLRTDGGGGRVNTDHFGTLLFYRAGSQNTLGMIKKLTALFPLLLLEAAPAAAPIATPFALARTAMPATAKTVPAVAVTTRTPLVAGIRTLRATKRTEQTKRFI